MEKRNILITGGSGYLGQILVRRLAAEFNVFYTFNSIQLECDDAVMGFKVNFETGDGLESCIKAINPVHAVVNCAAISTILGCEKDPDAARAVNIPTKLLECLQVYSDSVHTPLFVQLSTDQVYDGSKPLWNEEDIATPVNAYGRSKLDAENFISATWPNYVILRSSVIYGESPQTPLPKTMFLDFVVNSLSASKKTSFFTDEYRNPVYAPDIASTITLFLRKDQGTKHRLVLNMGGPERLSRLDFAVKVASHLKLDTSCIEPSLSATVNRGAPYPLDISMNVSKIQAAGIILTRLDDALKELFDS